jgi:UDP-N-acetylmuramate-alanine ligase
MSEIPPKAPAAVAAGEQDETRDLCLWLEGGARRIHLIGVAGSGMSGIAALLLELGHHVSGSDKVTTVEVERLRTAGLEFFSPSNAVAAGAAARRLRPIPAAADPTARPWAAAAARRQAARGGGRWQRVPE